ncbi:MAG: CARDB domain-containing protein, partial [Planctomycetaceae bacterium]
MKLPPASIVLTLDEAVRADSVQAADLAFATPGVTVTGATLVDGRTVRFDVSFPAASGTVDYSLADGAFTGLGGAASAAFTGTFRFDTAGPQVTSTSPSALAAGWNDVTFFFNEPLDRASVTVAAITAFTGPDGQDYRNWISQVEASADGTQVTVRLQPLARSGPYTLTLGDAIRDVAGNPLDQNGDGTADAHAVTLQLRGPDLVVANLSITPATLQSGDTVTIRWADANVGDASTSYGWYDFVRVVNTRTNETLVDTYLPWQSQAIAAGSSLLREYAFTLPEGSRGVGDISIRVTVDGWNYHPETNETGTADANNATSLTLPSTLASTADLAVTSATAPASGRFGDPLEFTYRVENIGTLAASTGWQDAFYLSVDGVVGGSDRLLATLPTTGSFGPLDPATGVTRSVTLQLPLATGLSPGTYRIIVVANASGQQREPDRTNNARASDPVAVTLPPLPDLVVADITAPPQGFAGQDVPVRWTVRNQGSADFTGTLTDAIRLSADQAIGGDLWLGQFAATVTIPAGGSITRTQSVALPMDISGTRRFVVETDVGGAAFEHSGEFNNATIDDADILVQVPPLPNLRVTTVTSPTSGFSSGQVLVSWTVTNAGTGPTNAPIWYDAVYLSTDDVFDGGDIRLGAQANPSYLGPGESYSSGLTVTLPRGISGGYRLIVRADDGDAVFEDASEGDNTRSTAFTAQLTPPPDLRVTAVAAPPQAASGATMPVKWTVLNGGSGQTLETSWHDAVYLSADTTLDPGDRLLGTLQRTGRLAAGGSYTASLSVMLPIGVSGSFHVLVRTDAFDTVFEHTAEGNNVGADPTPVDIRLTAPPDLAVTGVTSPATAIANQAIEVSYAVANVGATATPENAWLDELFMSTDDAVDPATDTLLASRWRYGTLEAESPDVAADRSGYSGRFTVTLPPTISGTRHLFVVTDRERRVFELERSNNAMRSTTPLVVSFLPPDLVADTVTAPDAASAGGSIPVGFRVRNVGTGPTNVAAWSDRVVLSADAVVGNADDVALADVPRPGSLAAAGSYTVAGSLVTIPLSVATGDYFLFVVADASAQVYEHTSESNNASAARPISITRSTADLRVTTVSVAPASLAAGGELAVSWTVANRGTAATNANWWTDAVYLSTDANLGDANDVLLGLVQHNDPLVADGDYGASRSFTLPASLPAGSYRVLVATDSGDRVIEGSGEGNNMTAAAAAVTVTAQPRPNLVVTTVDAPPAGTAGQTLAVSWTVRNSGVAAAAGRWFDGVYLSLDQTLDASDRFLGFAERSGPLAPAADSAASASFRLPQGVAGAYYIFVVADAGDAVSESAEGDNATLDVEPVTLTLPPPADLVAGSIAVPTTAVSGGPLAITYTVRNDGVNAATGAWTDALFLSADAVWDPGDVPLGRVEVAATVGGGSQYSRTLNTTAPAVTPATYRVIVRTDIRNAVPESSNANNLGASVDAVMFDVPELVLGAPVTGDLPAAATACWKVVVPVGGETVRIVFDSGSDEGDTAVFVRRGGVPTAAVYDIGSSAPFQADQSVVVPADEAATYYVVVQRRAGSGGFTLRAETVPFTVTGAAPAAAGNGGEVTVRIDGARFTATTVFHLVATGGGTTAATRTVLAGSATAYATFDLTGVAAGSYVLRATGGAAVATAPAAFVVQAGAGPEVVTQVEGPVSVRPDTTYTFRILYGNEGDRDIAAPLLVVRAPSAIGLGGSAGDLATGGVYQALATSPDGPERTLRPGGRGAATVAFRTADGSVAVDVSVRAVTPSDTTAISDADWVQLERSARPAGVSDAAWTTFWAGFRAAVGVTWGDYVRTVGRMAADVGGRPHDVRGMFATVLADHPAFDPALGVKEAAPAPGTGPALPALPAGPAFGAWRELDRGGRVYLARYRPQVIVPIDPNDIVNPVGFGPDGWIRADQKIPYMIRFENSAAASAPAQVVRITQKLDPDLNANAFRLGDFAFDNLAFQVPENVAFYTTRLDLTAARGYLVDVAAGIDVVKREAFWTFTTIDPATGEQPLDATVGFLPVNDATGRGDGHVSYTIRAKSTVATGARVDAGLVDAANDFRATIVFDTEAPILTPSVFNTLDADAPSSSIAPLPATAPATTFQVAWSGTDAGSGLAAFTVYVSENGGAFAPWLENTTARSADFVGAEGRTYAFYSVASDNVGNVESVPLVSGSIVPDATTRVPGLSPPTHAVTGTLAALSTLLGEASSVATVAVTGANLTAAIVATAPAGFEVSSDGVAFGPTATFTPAAGTVSGTLSVRLAAANAVGTYSGHVVLATAGASDVSVVLPAGTVTDELIFDVASGQTLNHSVGRSAAVKDIKRGLGTLVLSGASGHTGQTTVEAGTLVVAAA